MRDDPTAPVIDVDEPAERAGWAVVTLAGRFDSPVAARALGGTIVELLGSGVDTVTVDASRSAELSAAACHVLVDAAGVAHHAGGCLVASGMAPDERTTLRRYDVDHRLGLAG